MQLSLSPYVACEDQDGRQIRRWFSQLSTECPLRGGALRSLLTSGQYSEGKRKLWVGLERALCHQT